MRNWFRYCLIAAYPAIDPTLSFCSALASASNAQLIVFAVAAGNAFITFAVWLAINGIASSSIRTYCTAIRSSLLDWSGIPANLTVEWRRFPRLMVEFELRNQIALLEEQKDINFHIANKINIYCYY
jgi:hypothetical protein